jgi:hypothetical protein
MLKSASAFFMLASALLNSILSGAGSISASGSPFFTSELKSAFRLFTVPWTWEPTPIVVSGFSVPVAVMSDITSFLSASAVL